MTLCAHVTSESTHRGRHVAMAPTPLFRPLGTPDPTRPTADDGDVLQGRIAAATSSLRAFAISLVGCSDRADDLVHDTLLKAWANSDRFESDSNLRGWLFTILWNAHCSQHREFKREVEDVDGAMAQRFPSPHLRTTI
jgi:DNA-directed RNA polymerase specialized sigma24 family protein